MSSDLTAEKSAAGAPASAGLVQRVGASSRPMQVVSSWLRAYALVGFSQSLMAGLFFALATLVVPAHGAVGFLGLVLCDLWARVMRRPAAHVDEGFYGFNGLLVGLALGLFFRLSWHLVGLLAVVSLLVVVVSGALRNLSDRYVGVPVMSLPFVLVTWCALLATRRFSAIEYTIDTVLVQHLGAGMVSGGVQLFFQSLAACFFQLSVVSGVLVFLGLLWSSRWAAILATVGFFVGHTVHTGLGGPAGDLEAHFVGFNFILTAIAVGGVFLVLSPATILLAGASGAMAAVISAATLGFLEPHGLPVLALPFILTTQLVVFALLTRTDGKGPQLVKGAPASPEENLRRKVFRERRYPDPSTPRFYLPVMGPWTITQGVDGEHTHQGLWSHAWDFEVHTPDGKPHRGAGTQVEQYLAWRAPVVAPADGKIVRVINHLPDNPVGEVDTRNNWGNLVIVWHAGGVYSALCHLQQGSVAVVEGQSVVRGQILGRVGNSGRSPVPHLHFQVQRSPEVGAPTVPARFLHYVVSGSTPQYVTHGVLEQGQTVFALSPDERARRALTLAPGRRYEWEIRTPEGVRREEWVSTIDALGGRRVEVVGESDHAEIYADAHYLTVLDFEGSRDSLLGLFALGVARAPYVTDSLLTWGDRPAATPFLSWTTRMTQELMMPFVAVGGVPTRSRMTQQDQDLVLATELETKGGTRQLPERLDVTFRPGVGPVEVRAFRGNDVMLAAEVVA